MQTTQSKPIRGKRPAIAICFLIWLVSLPIIVKFLGDPAVRPDLEANLRGHSREVHCDALAGLNRLAPSLAMVVSTAMALTASFLIARRWSELTVLCIGLAIGAAFAAVATNWADPDWYVILAVMQIGLLVGIGASLVFWFVAGVLHRLCEVVIGG